MAKKIYFTGADSFKDADRHFGKIVELGGTPEGGLHMLGGNLKAPFEKADSEVIKWTFDGDIDIFPDWFKETTWCYENLLEDYPIWYSEVLNTIMDYDGDEVASDAFKEFLLTFESEDRERRFKESYFCWKLNDFNPHLNWYNQNPGPQF